MNIRVEEMTFAHLPQIIEMSSKHKGISLLNYETEQNLTTAIQSDLNRTLSSVALNEKDQLVGCMFLFNGGRETAIHHMFVLEEYRHNGIAKKMFERSCGQLVQTSYVRRCRAFVLVENKTSLAVFQKLGFRKSTGTPQDDSIISTLTLDL